MTTTVARLLVAVAVLILAAIGLPGTLGQRTSVQARQAAQAGPAPKPPGLTLAIDAHVQVGTPLEVGAVPRGRRRIVSINGGTFSGPNGLKGKVLPGGADWQIIRPDGFAE